MELMTVLSTVSGLAVTGGIMVMGGLFYIRSVKYFRPSELVAVSKPKEDTGLVNEKGEVIYSYYSYQQGGRVFIPFWKGYYVLPVYIINTNIKTGKLLTRDQLHISANIAIQYSIDISSEEKRTQAFSRYREFVRYKSKITNNDISDVLNKDVKPIILGIIPKVVGQTNLDNIIGNREKTSLQLQEMIIDKMEDIGLKLEFSEIINITIETKHYFKPL